MTIFSKVLSYIFQPLLVPFYGICFLLYWPSDSRSFLLTDVLYFIPDQNKTGLLIVLGTLTVVAPVFSILILFWSRITSSIELKEAPERRIPYIMTLFYVILAYFIIYRAPEGSLSVFINAALFSGVLSLLILYFLLPYIKLSAHMASLGGMGGFFLAYSREVQLSNSLEIVTGIILLSGLVAAARLKLEAHNDKEIYLSYILNFVIYYVVAAFKWFP